jgi:hypothetical protein
VEVHWTAKSLTEMFVSLIVTSEHLPATRLRHSYHRLHLLLLLLLLLLPFSHSESVTMGYNIHFRIIQSVYPTGLTRPLFCSCMEQKLNRVNRTCKIMINDAFCHLLHDIRSFNIFLKKSLLNNILFNSKISGFIRSK